MITLRLACWTALIAALAAGCASPRPRGERHPPEPVTVSPQSNGASPTPNDDRPRRRRTSPSDSPAPSATDAAVRLSGNGPLAAGRYYLDDRHFTNARRRTFTLPAGWTTEEFGELYKDRDEPGEGKYITWVLTHVFSDVCQWGPLVDVGTTVDELVTALTEQEGREASAPTTVTVGGFPAKRLELTVPADLDTATCTNGVLRYLPAPGPNMSDGDCCASPGSTDSVYVVDIAGNRRLSSPGITRTVRRRIVAELQGVVDSIDIEP